jgi:hypothetical protein
MLGKILELGQQIFFDGCIALKGIFTQDKYRKDPEDITQLRQTIFATPETLGRKDVV